jgi:D-alanyl-D-alanine carboxypeptidase (penicillin-binding protein 5/6)
MTRFIAVAVRSLRASLAALALSASLGQAAAPPPPSIAGKAWIVGDLSSGQILASQNADTRVDPASLTKLMTAYLVFTALGEGKLRLDQEVPVSVHAWRAPGSRMFIEPRKPVTVEQLILGMEVQSGNDATIALAEAIGGSEELFAQLMNREAARLGMTSTHFMNATGLPDDKHYTTAADLYRLSAALIRDFPQQYARYYAVKEFRYNNISQQNRNRLLWLDPSVDGVKTGHTDAAGFCLIASAKRGERRLLSVLLGAVSESGRAQESLKLLNWGYQFFDSVKLYAGGQPVRSLDVWKGAQRAVKVGVKNDLLVDVPKGEAEKLKAELVSQQPLLAPLAQGQRVGSVRVSFDGKPLGEYPLVALEPVRVAGLFGRAWDTLRLWFK